VEPEALQKVKGIDTLQLLKSILTQSNLPACVIIDDMANIIYIHGRTGRYLEPAQGETSINIMEMARPGLKAGLTSAIRAMANDRQESFVKNLQVKENGGYTSVNLIVKPMPDFQSGSRGLMMVIFDENELAETKTTTTRPRHKLGGKKKNEDVSRLEDELQYTKENLQTTIEELETSNEELKSTNEELQSTNEELQSTNEELETSKEELQSLNEESATVNAELQSRIDELSKTNNDMKNLLSATQIATIFIDIELCVKRFTSHVTSLVPLESSDIGRPINHFATNLRNVNLKELSQQVLNDLVTKDFECESTDGRFFRSRLMPYRTTNNVIDGVVITFDDISIRREVEKQLEERRVLLEAVLECSANGIVACDRDGILSYFNRAASEFHGLPVKAIPPEQWSNYSKTR